MRSSGIVNPLLNTIGEDVMGFLNEVQLKYPRAISFASGRPDERYFDMQDFHDHFNVYVDAMAQATKNDRRTILNELGQYNRTKGIINDLVARYLEKDEAIHAAAGDILITVGTQEAVAVTVTTLCDREKDVILVEDPTYIGITHFSVIAGYCLEAVPIDTRGISLELLENKIISCNEKGKKVKIVYIIADHQNPTGHTMPLEERYRLLELADRYDFFIIEDNAYGEFTYDEAKVPALKALDKKKRVIYLRSFSKTLYPSLRLGAIVADQVIVENGKITALSDLMAKVKGYITVNTPAITQAVLGGMLISNDFSLKAVNQNKIGATKRKRDQMLASLKECLNPEKFAWAKNISWNIPQGGFFITVRVPFKVDKEAVILCVEKYLLIFTPMSFFYFATGGEREIRLAFSQLSESEIRTGIERLSLYIKDTITFN